MLNELSTFLGVFARGNKKNNVCRSDSAKKKHILNQERLFWTQKSA